MTEQSLDRVLKMLKDGQWHALDEIAEKAKLSVVKMQHVAIFLAKYSFVELDPKNSKVKLTSLFRKFLKKVAVDTSKNAC